MGKERIREALAHEATLKPEDECVARWTNCGSYHEGRVKVVRVNEKSVLVELMENAPTRLDPKHGYPKGHRLSIPRFLDIQRWSENNRLMPLQEGHYDEPEITTQRGISPVILHGAER